MDGPGILDFLGTDIQLEFASSGSYPDGEVVISKLHVSPDSFPDLDSSITSYWILNNYGSNSSFSALESIKISSVDGLEEHSVPADFSLYTRGQHETGNSWSTGVKSDSVNYNADVVRFENGLTIGTAAQFSMSSTKPWRWIGVVDTDWHNSGNWENGVLPDAASFVIIPPGTPHYPVVDSDVQIRLLCIELGASLLVDPSVNFSVEE